MDTGDMIIIILAFVLVVTISLASIDTSTSASEQLEFCQDHDYASAGITGTMLNQDTVCKRYNANTQEIESRRFCYYENIIGWC